MNLIQFTVGMFDKLLEHLLQLRPLSRFNDAAEHKF